MDLINHQNNPIDTEPKTRIAIYDCVREQPIYPEPSSIRLHRYDHHLKAHPEWVLVDRYVDVLSHKTPPDERKEYNRLIRDCQRGLIDLIVIPTITRLSWSLVEFMSDVRAFMALKPRVDVFFIYENIDTRKNEDTAPLIYFQNLCMEEAEKLSAAAIEGTMQRFSKGTYKDTNK